MAEEEVARISVAVRCRPLSEHDAGSAGMGRDGKEGWSHGGSLDFFLRLKNTKKQRFHGILVNDVEHQKIHGMASDDSWQVQPEICHNMSEPLATLCYAMLRYATLCCTPHSGEKQHGAEHLQGYGWTIGDSSGSRCHDMRWQTEPMGFLMFFEPQIVLSCCLTP